MSSLPLRHVYCSSFSNTDNRIGLSSTQHGLLFIFFNRITYSGWDFNYANRLSSWRFCVQSTYTTQSGFCSKIMDTLWSQTIGFETNEEILAPVSHNWPMITVWSYTGDTFGEPHWSVLGHKKDRRGAGQNWKCTIDFCGIPDSDLKNTYCYISCMFFKGYCGNSFFRFWGILK